jgi:hypothetical protein
MVSLPAESATFFSRRLEAMINELLMRIQPDAKFDPRTHVMNELDELNRELSRLREVIGAETTRQTVTDGPQQPEPPDEQRDHEALQKLRADLKAIAEGPPPGGSGSTARAVMLYVLQEVFNAALGRFDKTVARADAGHEARERTARLLLALQSFEANVEDARGKLYDEYQGVRTPRREAGRTRRLRR